ncbi:PREDICTED: alpha-N-acetylgalactosaminide alpha-2,6-sialyltransferase 2-like [Branchiostoma belcheri]|uniref:alpha-N-acetylgalactosaminide alpha-2,6-sialyltransferase n=1 Tax=Branchiostoma belcheri TaxID=7741 RepID=A0A6P4ZA94_BRABE|nr:PREDICTED: alpha-N-acetylgalactosaminide alpha-2,6-sialyltransferase 2-like [Branchiostoma belcheri]
MTRKQDFRPLRHSVPTFRVKQACLLLAIACYVVILFCLLETYYGDYIALRNLGESRPVGRQSSAWFLDAHHSTPIMQPPIQKYVINREIPVLLTKSHVTFSKYERLKRYRPPYGWANVSWEDVTSAVQHFNGTVHRSLFNVSQGGAPVRCAVVGNGGNLRASGKGKEIDSHDYIFRMNAAIVKGFEKDVGRRTSFYFHSVTTLKSSLISARKYGFVQVPNTTETIYVDIPTLERDYLFMDAMLSWKPVQKGEDTSESHRPPGLFGERPKASRFRMIHPDFLSYLKYRWLNSTFGYGRYQRIYRPSTGAVALLTALHVCDVTDAYGFITQTWRNYTSHYYEDTFRTFVLVANHDFEMEIKLWDDLDRAGIISLYRGNITGR